VRDWAITCSGGTNVKSDWQSFANERRSRIEKGLP
jgi:hypothetical protein